jgi:uncharacterized protein YbbC (DUF1343 family)
MNADSVAKLLQDRGLTGVRFEAERFTPNAPTDGKFGGRSVPGVRIIVEDRDRLQAGRIGAAVLWAIHRASGDSLRIQARGFDQRFGTSSGREAILGSGDPDEVIDAALPGVVAFQQATRKYLIYR